MPGPLSVAGSAGLGMRLGTTRRRCGTRWGSVAAMNTIEDIHPSLTKLEVTEEIIAVSGGGVRVLELGLVTLLGLLVCPPFFILAVVVTVPVMAISPLVRGVVVASAGRCGSCAASAPTTGSI